MVQLVDDAFVSTKEAALFLGFQPESLRWYRNCRPQCSPKFYKVGARSIRYKMRDLRAFANGDPSGYQAPRVVAEG
ncbi:MAG: hypothetical protein L0H22_04785 [Brevibacterium aurantiacum]|nr:hypothetical protein [Brevibacterium aurantiacum]